MPTTVVAGATRAPRRARLRTARTAVVGLAALFAVAGPGFPLADAQEADPRTEREQVQAERAQAAAELDAAQADFRKVSAALGDLQALVGGVRARLADAERAHQTAEDTANAARTAEQAAIDDIRSLEDEVQTAAVDAYVNPTVVPDGARVPAESLTEQALRDALIDLRSNRSADLLDRLAAARDDLVDQRRVAEAAAEEAEARRAEVARRAAELEEAEAQFADLAQQVENRVNHLATEVESLAQQDAELAAEIAAQQAELAAAVPSDIVTGSPVLISPGSPVSVVSVGGITVATSIAGQVEAMLNAARADGVTLTGSGYRDPAEQIALRRQNCGSSNYAIYQAPSSSCSPPTAIPGSSNHERGLAIDFRNCSHGSSCFRWLSGNASRFGFYNLPSESWHWSVDGS